MNTTEADGYVWSITFDTPTIVGGVTNAGDQPSLYVNARMLGNVTSGSYFRAEVRNEGNTNIDESQRL